MKKDIRTKGYSEFTIEQLREEYNYHLEEATIAALNMTGKKSEYTNRQLFDAAIVFMEVFMSKMYDKHSPALDQQQLLTLAEEAGKSLHQTIELFTGVDMKDVYKQENQ